MTQRFSSIFLEGVHRSYRIAGIAVVICLFLICSAAQAQLSTASVHGTVLDSTGAVIPGAQINLQNVSTKIMRTTTTNSAGSYAFVGIDPGNYTLAASKDSFSTAQQNAVALSVNQTATFNFTLNVGSQVQQVTVTSAASQLQGSTANLGTLFSTKTVNDLPLNGRNFTELLLLTPGASPVNNSQNNGSPDTIEIGATSFPSMNGQLNRSNLFLMDGIINQQTFFSVYAVQPIVDAVQEFKIQSHNDQSEFGGVLGAVINVVTKSGTNNLHGDAWEFLRNDAVDAANPLTHKKTPLKQSVYGLTIGGPVVLPFYHKKRTFFFGAYEGTSINTASSTLYNTPTPAQISGDLSSITQQIYDPFSTTPDPANPGQFLRTPFTNNQIQSRLDPNMVNFATMILPKPLATPVSGFNGLDLTPGQTRQNNYSVRIDHQFNDSNSIWARLNQVHTTKTGSGGFTGLLNTTVADGQNWAVSYLHTFGSSATLQLQAGHAWQFIKTQTALQNKSSSLQSDVGYDNAFACGFLPPAACQIPSVSISGYLSGGESYQTTTGTDIYEYKAYFTKLIGNHVIQLGADFAPNTGGVVNTDNVIGYSAFQTSDLEGTANTGNALASFLMGVPANVSHRNLEKSLIDAMFNSAYVQDQWKISPRLTLIYGLRYDWVQQPQLAKNPTQSNLTGSYDFSNGTYVITKSAGNLGDCATLGAAPCLPGGIGNLPAHVVVSKSNRLIANEYDNWQPRVGLAYMLRPSTVLHLSYARVYDTWSSELQGAQNEGALWPSVGISSNNNLNETTVTAPAENPLGDQISSLPAATPFATVAYFVDPHIKNPESDQWTVGMQQQIGSKTIFSLNYVGSVSRRLPCCDYYNTALTPGPGVPQSRSPYPYAAPTHYEQSIGSSNYNALQAQLHQQFSNGLSYSVNYTWSKTIDVACDGFFGVEGCFITNVYNPQADRSVAGFDVPQILTISALYHLPFGTGQQYRSGNRVLDTVIGGWQVNGIYRTNSGVPYTVSYSGDRANTGNNYQGADLIGNPHLSHPTAAEYFNTAAFQTPAVYTYGTAPRNLLRTATQRDLDLSLFRTFSLKRVRVELRAEAFNALNMFYYAQPNATVNSTTFGQVTSLNNTPRQMQGAIKIYF